MIIKWSSYLKCTLICQFEDKISENIIGRKKISAIIDYLCLWINSKDPIRYRSKFEIDSNPVMLRLDIKSNQHIKQHHLPHIFKTISNTQKKRATKKKHKNFEINKI
jgi:hypothetical protein